MSVLVTFGGLALFAAGFLAGKLHERFAWNDLITKGILPRPRQR